ncbi:hypothetical protein BGZ52_012501 [Haplosporangium bisporale]|nr:hypothetical protein BGZ52_012501 [Haplosporangium bisporale]
MATRTSKPAATNTTNAWESSRLASSHGWIVDDQNRVVILHGVNLSGGAKMPTQDLATNQDNIGAQRADGVPGVVYSYEEEHFFHHRNVSFVNRPFPLEEADLHFQRLARWGCQCLRVLVPWEALEHAGPGIYDEDYINYLIDLLKVAAKYGLKCFLDPHVDCWSRFTGGSGMPGWTLELAGMDITRFRDTLAATVHNTAPEHEKENYPHMIWATNSFKTAAATMYTLFFSGQIFAPKAMVPLSTTVLSYLRKLHSTTVADEAYRHGVIGGTKAPSPIQNLIPVPRVDHDFIKEGMVNIQHYLQGHFMEAFAHLAERVTLEDQNDSTGNGLISSGTVMGFDSLNEPSPGYLNHFDLSSMLELADLQVGACPTPIQGFQLAQGATVECQVWHTGGLGPQKKGKVKVNEGKVNIWKRPFWKSTSLAKANFNTGINPPSAPSPLRHPGRGVDARLSSPSPFDSISQLDIAAAPILTTAASMTASMAEDQISKTLWPQPLGYSDTCLWALHKVWEPKTGELLQPNYFQRFPSRAVYYGFQPGKEIEWKQDFWLPFVNTFSLRLRQQDPRLAIFVEPPINEAPPMFRLNKILIGGAADHVMNMFRAMTSWVTSSSAEPSPVSRRLYRNQHFKQFSRSASGGNQVDPNSDDDPSSQNASKGKGKGPKGHSRSENDLFDNACENPSFDPIGDVSENVMVAPHFYDGYSNITRDFVPMTLDFLGYKRGLYWSALGALKLGWGGVGQVWQDQVLGIQSDIRYAMGHEHAIIMGETGLPMDMHDKASFKNRYGAPKQSFALQMMLDAMDHAMLSFTLWNYCVDNSNHWGDRWNGEDFSVWCPPDSMFLKPEFQSLMTRPPPMAGSSTALVQGSQASLVSVPSQSNPGMTLKVVSTELGTGKETAGCSEGFLWWCCLPGSHVWTKRTAPRRVTVFAVEPSESGAGLSGSELDPASLSSSVATDSSIISAVGAKKEKSPPPLTIDSWQDLLPLSVQLERGRLDLYGGLRVGESFVRAYPLAVFGEPILYKFEPGKPISTSDILGGRGITRSNKTNDAPSWENRFRIIFRTECGRPVTRPSGSLSCTASGAPMMPGGKSEIVNADNNNSYGQEGQGGGYDPSTDLFLPRFHFALTSTVGQDQFESLQIVNEMLQQQEMLQQHYQSSSGAASNTSSQSTPLIKKSKWDKGRWNRFDVQVTDGRYLIQPSRQILQYWTAPQPTVDPHDNLAPVAEMFDRAEARIKALIEQQGWDGIQGITTSSEKEWIKKLAAAVKQGEEAARRSVERSLLTYVWPFTKCAGRPLSETEKEERIRLKYKELQQQWRDRIGLPAKGAAFCHTCGQLEVMHLHGVTVSLQMWSGYRG